MSRTIITEVKVKDGDIGKALGILKKRLAHPLTLTADERLRINFSNVKHLRHQAPRRTVKQKR